MKTTPFLLLLSILFLSFSCSNSSEGDLIEQVDPVEIISYDTHIKSIFDTNCVACHSNPAINGAGVPLTTFSQVKSAIEATDLIDRINRQSGEGGFMPLGGSRMPQAAINLIIQWQTEGFVESL